MRYLVDIYEQNDPQKEVKADVQRGSHNFEYLVGRVPGETDGTTTESNKSWAIW